MTANSAHDVLIITPDEELSLSLLHALASAAVARDVRLHDSYPVQGEVPDLLVHDDRRTTAVIIDLSDADKAMNIIHEIRESDPSVQFVGTAADGSADSLRALATAGVSELLIRPFGDEQVVSSLQSLNGKGTEDLSGKVVCFVPAQGGNGASTAAVELANSINRIKGGKVLILDLDAHSSSLPFRLKVQADFTLSDALEKIEDLDDLWDQIVWSSDDLDLLPAPHPSWRMSSHNYGRLRKVIKKAANRYPFVIVDLPTLLEPHHIEVLALCSEVYLVSTADVVSLHLARKRLESLLDLGVNKGKVRLIVNKYSGGDDVKESKIGELVGLPVVQTLDRDDRRVQQLVLESAFVPANSKLGRQFGQIADRIVGSEESSARPKGLLGRLRSRRWSH